MYRDIYYDCIRCGEFVISDVTIDDLGLPFKDKKKAALAAHMLRKLQNGESPPELRRNFFEALEGRKLPSPAMQMDNLLLWIGHKTEGQPGSLCTLRNNDPAHQATIGVVDKDDMSWLIRGLEDRGMIKVDRGLDNRPRANLTPQGWELWEALRRGHRVSNFAFFARRFENADLAVLIHPAEESGWRE